MRFSSKPWLAHNGSNTEGLYYYGYRFYDPQTQRWLNRDPLGGYPDVRLRTANGQGYGLSPWEFFQGPNLYTYVYNDPVNGLDPDGLSAIGKVFPKIIKLIKGRRAVKATSVDDAIRLYKEGESFVMCPTKDAAKEAARKAGGGSPPIHEIDKKTGAPHYHPRDRSGHFLYGIAGALTFGHYAEGHGGFLEGAAFVGDLFNPLSLPQDILDIINGIFE
jgi:RHS repeat-associated protein